MCSQVRCQTCGKPTWAGCGGHIEQALADVPRNERCRCREDDQKAAGDGATAVRKKLFGLFG